MEISAAPHGLAISARVPIAAPHRHFRRTLRRLVHRPRSRLAREPARAPGGLEVVAADQAVEIEDLAREVQAGDHAALERSRVELIQRRHRRWSPRPSRIRGCPGSAAAALCRRRPVDVARRATGPGPSGREGCPPLRRRIPPAGGGSTRATGRKAAADPGGSTPGSSGRAPRERSGTQVEPQGEPLGVVGPRHRPANIQDRRTGEPEVGKEDRLTPFLQEPSIRRLDRGHGVGQGDPAQVGDPFRSDSHRHQRRPRLDDRMAQPAGDLVAVARRAAARIGTAPHRDDHPARDDRRIRRANREPRRMPRAPADRLDPHDGAQAAERRAGALETPQQRSRTSIARSEAGKTLPLPSILVTTLASSKSRIVASTSRRRSDGPRNAPWSPNACWIERVPRPWPASYAGSIGPRHGIEPAQAPGIGDVAPRASGDQDLHPGPPVLLQEDDPGAALRGPCGGHQPGGPGAEHGHVAVESASRVRSRGPTGSGVAAPPLARGRGPGME